MVEGLMPVHVPDQLHFQARDRVRHVAEVVPVQSAPVYEVNTTFATLPVPIRFASRILAKERMQVSLTIRAGTGYLFEWFFHVPG